MPKGCPHWANGFSGARNYTLTTYGRERAPLPHNHNPGSRAANMVLGQRRRQRVHGLSVSMAPAAIVPDESAVMATGFVLVYVRRLSPFWVVAAHALLMLTSIRARLARRSMPPPPLSLPSVSSPRRPMPSPSSSPSLPSSPLCWCAAFAVLQPSPHRRRCHRRRCGGSPSLSSSAAPSFQLRLRFSALLASAYRADERERVTCGLAWSVWSGSGAVGGPVPLTVTSWWYWSFAHL